MFCSSFTDQVIDHFMSPRNVGDMPDANADVKERLQTGKINALGLVQGQLAEMVMAGDVAEKASNVEIAEISGVCPQHISMIGIFGDTAAVTEALNAIEKWEKKQS